MKVPFLRKKIIWLINLTFFI